MAGVDFFRTLPIKRFRSFGGKRYEYYDHHDWKTGAKEDVDRLRKKGHYARIVTAKGDYDRKGNRKTWYIVYKRRGGKR